MPDLRNLAGAAAVLMAIMSALATLAQHYDVRIAFRPALVGETIRLASNQANAALHLAMGGQGEQKQQVPAPPPDPAVALQADAVGRLQAKIPAELYSYFDIYIYVSKAGSGSLSQHAYLFRKISDNSLIFEQSFPVSTGRERYERYFTSTPTGLFELDPDRFEVSHYSRTWHAPMPWAMFLNATIKGRQTGVALHSAGSHIAQLGSRASGGCVRLPPEKAAELFQRFQKEERGYVPVFAYDRANRRTSGDGVVLRGADGKPLLVPGYKVLVFIEDYGGSSTPALVAVVV